MRRFVTPETMPETSAHHQYSLRLARPENVAYFMKKRATASPKLAPCRGAQSGTGPDAAPWYAGAAYGFDAHPVLCRGCSLGHSCWPESCGG
jgi:hypothetical protein